MLRPFSAARSLGLCLVIAGTLVVACSGDEFTPTGGAAGGAGESASPAGAGGSSATGGTAGGVAGGAAGNDPAGGAAGDTQAGSAGSSGAATGGAGSGGASPGCTSNADCEAQAGPCRKGSCGAQGCVFTNDDQKLPVDKEGDCRKPTCVEGVPATRLELTDVPAVSEPCFVGDCKANGDPGVTAGNDGKSCGDGRFCANGGCVACQGDGDCPKYAVDACLVATGCKNGVCQTADNAKGQPDKQPNDCIEETCVAGGKTGKSFSKQGKDCTDGAALIGKCDGQGTCKPLLPKP